MTDAPISLSPTDHATVEERRQHGRALRKDVPRSSLADWTAGPDRPDPVALLEEQNEARLPQLLPIRRGRMGVSAFTFYRGAARIMATDLATTPATGLTVQACGDAHLSNFGAFASTGRRLVFDVNDFDETLPGPWEWDVKRMATSFVVAGRDRGFDDADGRAAARESVDSYREAMARFATMRTLDVWYAMIAVKDIVPLVPSKRAKRRLAMFEQKAKSKDSLQAFAKLTEKVNGRYRIRNDAPVLVPLRDLPAADDPEALRAAVDETFTAYRSTLADNRQHVLDRFRPVDLALKVVGVGSVGTRCLILLMMGRDADDPLFLQIKEATASVLEEHLPDSVYDDHGERVVRGQRLTQATSDIFLGWSRGYRGYHYYWRQLKDWKGSVNIDKMRPEGLVAYARLCGWTLAHGHARSGDPIAIAGYLGKGKVAIEAFTAFAETYADQNEKDYAAFRAAIDGGSLATAEG